MPNTSAPETSLKEEKMAADHVTALKRSRAKLVEQRRSLVKRDCSHDRNEGYSERIVAIQAAIESTDRAILEEENALMQLVETSVAAA
jgi:hypothetical protein